MTPEDVTKIDHDLKLNGQLQPGVAWRDPGRSRLVLVCGERRYRALKLAGIATMQLKVIRGSLSPANDFRGAPDPVSARLLKSCLKTASSC